MIEFMLQATLVGSFALALVVWLSDSRRLSNQLFAGIAFCFGVWSLSILLFSMTSDPLYALSYAKIYYAGSVIFTPLLVLFAIHYPRAHPLARVYVVPMTALAILVSLVILLNDTAIIQSLQRVDGYWQVQVNKVGYWLFAGYFVCYFATAVAITFYKYFTYRGAERLRASYYALGIVATSIPGFIFDLALPYYGDYRYIWIGPVASSAFLLASGYSIARHRLLNVKAFLSKTAFYLLLIATLVAFYSGLLYVLTSLLLGDKASNEITFAANVGIALIIAFSFNSLRRFFDRTTRRVFYGHHYNSQKVIDEISGLSVKITDLDVLLESVAAKISETLNPRYVAVIFQDNAHSNVVYGRVSARVIDPSYVARMYEQSQRGETSASGAQVYRLETPSQDLGYFVIGPERDGRPYGTEDEHVMSVVSDELSIAIQNIYRLEEIRAFAGTLEKEVGAATRELRASNKKLLEMDATKDEFVSIASHQLRTPLTSVKGYISMVLEGDAGEITEPQRQLLEEAFTSSERMVHLISDFLNVSRLQTGKFMLDRRLVDLSTIVQQEVEGIRQIADTHDIAIAFKKPARFPQLYLDEGKLRQVVMNFIDNAIYYSPEGTKILVKLAVEDGEAVLRVKDQGIGVPADVQQHLFTKFFRAENARRQRPDGTGIGLYLAKRVIDGHSGRLVFESKLDKGSTFGFRLPIKKLQTPPPAQQSE